MIINDNEHSPERPAPRTKPAQRTRSSISTRSRKEPKSQPSPPARPLPLLRTFDDAEALAQKENDPFYLTAFAAQCWLGDLVRQAAAEYAEKKNPKDRSLQSGQGWHGFLNLFDSAFDLQGSKFGPQASEVSALLSQLFRFAEYNDPLAGLLRHSLHPLSVEHGCTGDYFGPKTVDVAKHPKEGLQLARRSLARWCDWLDAIIHFKTHQHWHLAPICFDPDPDKRELAALGLNQRHLARLDESAKLWWLWHVTEAAERFKDSPKWPALGKAMAAATGSAGALAGAKSQGPFAPRLWRYQDLDTFVIALWPLVKHYNWTYRDLLNVIRPGLKRPDAYPCDTEQGFAAYCPTVLGLRKTGKGASATNGRPPGYDIALQLCPLSTPPPDVLPMS